jgi:hypothetical protein
MTFKLSTGDISFASIPNNMPDKKKSSNILNNLVTLAEEDLMEVSNEDSSNSISNCSPSPSVSLPSKSASSSSSEANSEKFRKKLQVEKEKR